MDDKGLVKESLSSPLAQGRTAEIYPWGDHHILKLYRDWCPPDWAEYEARIAHAVYEAGIPCPQAGEIVKVDGRRGLVYEHLDGISMLQDMNARPWRLFQHARALAELQASIHRKSVEGLPSYRTACVMTSTGPRISLSTYARKYWRGSIFSRMETGSATATITPGMCCSQKMGRSSSTG